jgi:hypothetical protein
VVISLLMIGPVVIGPLVIGPLVIGPLVTCASRDGGTDSGEAELSRARLDREPNTDDSLRIDPARLSAQAPHRDRASLVHRA